MKKGVIIALIVLVGGTLLILPLLKNEEDPVLTKSPVEFAQAENVKTPLDRAIDLSLNIDNDIIKVTKLKVMCKGKLVQEWTNPGKSVTFRLTAADYGMGIHDLYFEAKDESGEKHSDSKSFMVISDIVPESWSIKIDDTHPHLPTSFTQGIEFYQGRLFEGTGDPGNQGKTFVSEVVLSTGELIAENKIELGQPYFGEGITVLDDKLYQITWQNQKCFVYDVNLLAKPKILAEFVYNGEGWGLCNNGSELIMSDGTNRIYFRDPGSFEVKRTIEVFDHVGPKIKINELEFIDELIYANVWQQAYILVIDPNSGKVLRQIDATEAVISGRGSGEVLNGIAHNSENGKTYITGKNWPKLFEVSFVKL